MKHYLLIDESNDVIIGSSNLLTSADGCRCVEVSAQGISGDSLPDQKKHMTGGKMTTGFAYTAPDSIPADSKLSAFKALDASAETGALKTLIEYLQR